jgi:hypothetical protein
MIFRVGFAATEKDDPVFRKGQRDRVAAATNLDGIVGVGHAKIQGLFVIPIQLEIDRLATTIYLWMYRADQRKARGAICEAIEPRR